MGKKEKYLSGESHSATPLVGVPDTDASLIDACRLGQEDAYEKLYRRYAGKVYGHLQRLLGPGPGSEDALQKTFIQAFRSLDRFNKTSKFSTWLYGIAVRVALNERRSKRRRFRLLQSLADTDSSSGGKPSSTPENKTASFELVEQLERCLDRVPPDRKIAFLLYYVEQRELHEIATLIGASKGATWKRIKRTREAVLQSMKRKGQTHRLMRAGQEEE